MNVFFAPRLPATDNPPPSVQTDFPPWGVGVALGGVGVFMAGQLLTGLGVALALETFAAPLAQAEQADARLLAWTIPVGTAVSHALSWALVFGLLVKRYRLPFWRGLGFRPVAWGALAQTAGWGLAMQMALIPLTLAFPPSPEGGLLDAFAELGTLARAQLALIAVVLAPMLEEVLFRGLLFPALRRRWGFFSTALATSGLFTLLHVFQTGWYWPALGAIFLCGWGLAWLRETRHNLWPPVAFHMGFNFTGLLPLLTGG